MYLTARRFFYPLVGIFFVISIMTGCPSKPSSSSCNNTPSTTADKDADGVPDTIDNCYRDYNPDQLDTDDDGQGNVCDPDDDGDQILDGDDNCPLVSNYLQLDSDKDGEGDECDTDIDGDQVDNDEDNCLTKFNPDQTDSDGDGFGDVCDDDFILPEERHFQMAVSPNPPEGMSSEQLISLVSSIADGIVISHFVDWDGTAGTYEELNSLVGLARQNGLGIIFAVEVVAEANRRELGPLPESMTNPLSPSYIPPEERNFENETLREIIATWCTTLAQDFHPDSMMVGVETDLYTFPFLQINYKNPDGEYFVTLYKEIYDEIKTIDPEIVVYTTFQWEVFKVLEILGLSSVLEAHWDYVDQFEGYLDLFSISTFPVAIPSYVIPESIPDDYYSLLEDRIDIPIALAETGWPSSGEGWGAEYRDEEAQRRWLSKVLKLTEGLDVRLINWFFLTDPIDTPDLIEYFYSSGLLYADGSAKLVFDRWQALFQVAYTGITQASSLSLP